MEYHDIEYSLNGNAAIVQLNRPEKLNAFTPETLTEIRHAVDSAAKDQNVIGIVITGAGRGFSSGLDAASLVSVTKSGGSQTARQHDPEALPGIFSYLLQTPKPVIAAINGVAAGGGLVLALMCDIRIAAQDARLTTVFLKRGLIAEHGVSWILPRLVGSGRALDLLWMSAMIGAEEAHRIGLVDRLADDSVQAAVDYIEKLAITSPPGAIAETKRLIYDHLGVDYRTALQDAARSTDRFTDTDDAREGATAFTEKRAPRFQRLGDE
jgi:enoyl-CoA hydratase/carnithine racemase